MFFALDCYSRTAWPPARPSPLIPQLNDKCSTDCRSVQIESGMNDGEGHCKERRQWDAPQPAHFLWWCEWLLTAPPPPPRPLASTHTHAPVHYSVSHRSSHWLPPSFYLTIHAFIYLSVYSFIFTFCFGSPRPPRATRWCSYFLFYFFSVFLCLFVFYFTPLRSISSAAPPDSFSR